MSIIFGGIIGFLFGFGSVMLVIGLALLVVSFVISIVHKIEARDPFAGKYMQESRHWFWRRNRLLGTVLTVIALFSLGAMWAMNSYLQLIPALPH